MSVSLISAAYEALWHRHLILSQNPPSSTIEDRTEAVDQTCSEAQDTEGYPQYPDQASDYEPI